MELSTSTTLTLWSSASLQPSSSASPSPSHSARRSSRSLCLLRLGAAHPGHAAFTALHRYHSGGPTTGPVSLPFSLALIGSLPAVPPADLASSPEVTHCSSVSCRPQTPWSGG